MAKVYLPIGSVVLLKNGKKRVMVYGRKVRAKGEEQVYDYVGCLYPEGCLSSDNVVLFNHEQIQMVYFIGFQDLEEIVFRQQLDKADSDNAEENETETNEAETDDAGTDKEVTSNE